MMKTGVTSETGVLHAVLLAAPDHYRWLPINSIVRRALAEGRQPDPAQLQHQHRAFTTALHAAGVTTHFMPPAPHLPCMVFTRDSSAVTPWGPFLAQMERPQRRGEYASVLEFHTGHSTPFWRMSSAGTIEGGDIHLIRPGLAVIGISAGRTSDAGAAQLAAWLRTEGWEVRLEMFDEHFLHLDVLFSMVAPGLALACTEALDGGFIDWLAGHGIRCLDVSYAETMALGCNVLSLGRDRVISTAANTRVNTMLRAEGLTVLDPDLSLFTRGGGGPRCLTCPLLREP